MLIEFAVSRIRNTASYETRDTLVSVSTAIVGSFGGLSVGAAYTGVLMFFYQYRAFDLEFSWGLLAICFLLDDFKYYWMHRIEHRVRWAWASHVNHHSSQHYNFSTAMRKTWTFPLTGLFLLSVPLVLFGFHPAMVALCIGLNLVYQFFVHTQMIGKLPGWYEAIMNTPSHHRVHHATNPKYLDANYAGTFIVWDRMFGTFVPEDAAEPCDYGIVKNLDTFNIITVIFHEWAALLRDVTRRDLGFRDRLGYMFLPPGWSHDGSRQTTDMIKLQHVRSNPEVAGQPGLPSIVPGLQAPPAE